MNLSVLLLEIIFATFGGAWENLRGRTRASHRVMTRIVIVGLYYKSKIVGLTPDSGIESQNSAVLSPGSGIVSQKWDVPYLPKWWSMRRRNWIFVFTR